MTLQRIADGFSRWIMSVAETAVALLGRLRAPRRVQLVEAAGDTFTLRIPGQPDAAAHSVRLANGRIEALPAALAATLRGSRTEIVLQSNRFLFRALELPKRAAEFLDGIVRAQIDRLTPWSAGDAVFGWTPPLDAAADRISLTVVATARALVAPYVQALTDAGAQSIVVSTLAQDGAPDRAAIQVFEHRARGALDPERVGRGLTAVFVIAALAAGIAVGAGWYFGGDLETQQSDLARRIAERRGAMRIGRDAGGDGSAQRLLERRKQETPSSVMVIEALSQVLPDHTYVTELRIEGDKLQVIGITRDAPSLIQLIEQSPHFTRATFFAPTTQSAGDPGESFHIEARIRPVFTAGT
jgi:general secretion pathway protein L